MSLAISRGSAQSDQTRPDPTRDSRLPLTRAVRFETPPDTNRLEPRHVENLQNCDKPGQQRHYVRTALQNGTQGVSFRQA